MSFAINHELQPVMDVINLAIFVVLFITFIYGMLQFRWEREAERRLNKEISDRELANNRTTFARSLYRDYLKVALEYPRLSNAEYDKDDSDAIDQYDTFVSIMLYAFDEMINQGGDAKTYWTPVIENQVGVHKKYMEELFGESSPGEFVSAYSESLIKIIKAKI